MHLFLEPIDVWMFRDGRPFDALSDHRAETLLPPYPTVIQGAIRSYQLVLADVDLRDSSAVKAAVGTAQDYGHLRLRGPHVATRHKDGRITRYYPQPADAITVNKENRTLRPASSPEPPLAGVKTSAPTPYLLGLRDTPTKGDTDLWLAEEDILRYLDGNEVSSKPSGDLFARESRFGIALDSDRRAAREGALYEAEFVRPQKDVGLLVEVEGYDGWPSSGLLRIGGEGRAARFEQVPAVLWPAVPDPLPDRFRLYFASPTYFRGGWQPEGGDWSRFFEGRVVLQAAAVYRCQGMGGFDLAVRGHKAARRYVPAGSVYYFESTGPARLRPGLVQGAISDFGAEIGFGQVIISHKGW